MTSATIPGLDTAPTKHQGLLSWVEEVAELTQPDRVVFADGSDEEWKRLTEQLVAAGTFKRLNPAKFPNSFLALSDPSDVARVESRTFICSEREIDAGPTNNWMDPAEMRSTLKDLYRGCMRGRTMYVVPFCMGPLGADDPKLGVEITDSEYVVVSMKVMTRMGKAALEKMGDDGFFVSSSFLKVPAASSCSHSRAFSSSEPSANTTRSGCVSSATSWTQPRSPACFVGAVSRPGMVAEVIKISCVTVSARTRSKASLVLITLL